MPTSEEGMSTIGQTQLWKRTISIIDISLLVDWNRKRGQGNIGTFIFSIQKK